MLCLEQQWLLLRLLVNVLRVNGNLTLSAGVLEQLRRSFVIDANTLRRELHRLRQLGSSKGIWAFVTSAAAMQLRDMPCCCRHDCCQSNVHSRLFCSHIHSQARRANCSDCSREGVRFGWHEASKIRRVWLIDRLYPDLLYCILHSLPIDVVNTNFELRALEKQ